ncbi:MAG TPA: type II secretion system F family protein, partial [Verrucomicrobiota bacterium]|nr:type II secretion system F family protein [Verrucomicrobiota bacterium]
MTSYYYEALDSTGLRSEGTIEVSDQIEAVRRIKEMGLFPTRIAEQRMARRINKAAAAQPHRSRAFSIHIPFLTDRVKPAIVAVFTRQLATLVDAGMPLLRGLRILYQQETNRALKNIIAHICQTIESGGMLSEALAAHPRVFSPLYVNMVRAGELGGSLDVTLRRLAEFIEKAQKIKGKVKSAMFYPVAVIIVAAAIMSVLMVYVIPRFRDIFDGLMGGAGLPAFTQFVFQLSAVVKDHFFIVAAVVACVVIGFCGLLKTDAGRRVFDLFKLRMPVLGNLFRKMAISRFARTLGTLLGSGVPVLQALGIVKETVGNVVVGRVVASIHDSVKEGETMTAPLRASNVFPPVIVGMVDVGEQTGALPDMLMKVADTCDDEVDNAVNGLTSLLEPVLIVFLAI